jgi:hypothetical protein
MAIISFDRDTLTDYVPAYGGNRESETPTLVSLRFVPYSRVQHYARAITARSKDVTERQKLVEITQEIQRKQFIESVDSVSNYYVGSREVVDSGEFYDTADTELIVEIIRAMESAQRLTEGQRKN